MKRILALCLFAAAAVFAWSQQTAAAGALDFSINLQDLYRAAQSGDDRFIPKNKSLILDGTVGSIMVRSDTETEFVAELELIGGTWNGDESVELLRAYIVFSGEQFRPFLARKAEGRLLSGDRILVLAQYLGIGVDYDETTAVAVVEGLALRPLR